MAGLRQAAAALAAQPFDHAVIELRLPDRNGLGLVASLREARPRARIVVVTDVDSFASVIVALRAGADDYMPQPVDKDELVDALLDRAPVLPPVRRLPLGLIAPVGSTSCASMSSATAT